MTPSTAETERDFLVRLGIRRTGRPRRARVAATQGARSQANRLEALMRNGSAAQPTGAGSGSRHVVTSPPPIAARTTSTTT
jgi:hypothetical protein